VKLNEELRMKNEGYFSFALAFALALALAFAFVWNMKNRPDNITGARGKKPATTMKTYSYK
jgi:hypothetical protein